MKKLGYPLTTLYLIAVPVLLLYNLTGGSLCFDTTYYQLAGDKLFAGQMDSLRTPLYPLVLKLCALGGGDHQVLWVTVVQSLVYLLSVWAMFVACREALKSEKAAFYTTMVYTLIPAASWCHVLLTESLSISGSVILLAACLRYLKTPHWGMGLWIHLLAAALVMLRPTFLVYLPILPCLWVYCWMKEHRKAYLGALAMSLIPIVLVVAYCGAYEQKYHQRGIAMTHDCNAVFTLKASGLWHPEELEEATLRDVCMAIDQASTPLCGYKPVYDYVERTGDIATLRKACDAMKAQHRADYLRYRMQLAVNGLEEQIPIHVDCTGNPLASAAYVAYRVFSLPVSLLAVTLLAAWALLGRACLKRREMPVATLLIAAICTCHLGGSLVSAIDSFGRVMLPIYPLFLMLLAQGVQLIRKASITD